MNDRTRILLTSLLLFGLTAAVSLSATWLHVADPELAGAIGQLEFTLTDIFIIVGIFAAFTYIILRFGRLAHASLPVMLLIAFLAGAQFILAPLVPSPWDLVAAVALMGIVWLMPRVIVHDIAILLGIGGVAGLLGLSLTPLIACGLLALLSVYDIVSVYRTRHMVALAGRMLESGAVFGFLIPAHPRVFLAPRDAALRERSVMMLGSGDIGLPLILATSAVSQSVGAAVAAVAGALVGMTVMHWLFMHQREEGAPMAALPPIALAAILGYLIAVGIGI